MKARLQIAALLTLMHGAAFSQNVGISDDNATPDPKAMLEVRRSNHAQLRIASKSSLDTTSIVLSNRSGGNSNSIGTDFNLTSIRETGLFFESKSSIPANATPNILVMRPNGNVGLGTPLPNHLLHATTTTKLRSGFFENAFDGSSAKYALYSLATAAGTGERYGLYSEAQSEGPDAFGVYGKAGDGAGGEGDTKYGVYGSAEGGGSLFGLYGHSIGSGTGDKYGVYGYANSTNPAGERFGVFGQAIGENGFAVYGLNTHANGFAGYFQGRGKVESDFIVGNDLAVFDINGFQSSLELNFRDNANNETVQIRAKDNASQVGGEINLYTTAGEKTIEIDGNWDGTGRGRVITDELEIKGGSDFAEHFDIIHELEQPQPGCLVSIAADGSGRLFVSNSAYDKRVAGVVSGAGGVRPGMVMGQQGTLADGQVPVALTGRAYVLADASFGPIQPGDALTTSGTPGHAMLASDRALAQGATIGKALTPLKAGKGLVLVLVNLQ